jgi:hypothetical protein
MIEIAHILQVTLFRGFRRLCMPKHERSYWIGSASLAQEFSSRVLGKSHCCFDFFKGGSRDRLRFCFAIGKD